MVYRWLLPFIIPFLAAWLLASWLHPAAVKLEKRTKMKKSIWGTILLFLLFGVLAFLLFFGVRELFGQLRTAAAGIPAVVRGAEALLERGCAFLEQAAGIPREDSRSSVLLYLSGMQKELLAAAGPFTLTKAVSLFRSMLVFSSGTLVTFISAALLLGDFSGFQKKILDYSWLVGVGRVIRQLKKTTAVYLKAQVILILLVASLCALFFRLMKSPYFLILGILLGILDALPIIGTGSFLYPAALVFLLKGNIFSAAGCVLLDILTSIVREYLEPRLLGGRLGVSPIMVLASVYIGMFLFGGWGVFLGPLYFSTVYETGKVWDMWD